MIRNLRLISGLADSYGARKHPMRAYGVLQRHCTPLLSVRSVRLNHLHESGLFYQPGRSGTGLSRFLARVRQMLMACICSAKGVI